MSIKYMAAVWEYDELKGSELLLILSLADHANDNGICWPSLPRLAKRARISKRQAQRVIKNLEDKGYIKVLRQGDGRGHSALYQVVLKGDTVSTLGKIKVDICDIKVDTQRAKVDTAMSTEPPIEPSLKQPEEEKHPLPPAKDAAAPNDAYAEIVNCYHTNIGTITQTVGEAIKHAQDDFPAEWIMEAIQESARYNKRSWAYAAKILNRWEREGRTTNTNGNNEPVTITRVEGDAYL